MRCGTLPDGQPHVLYFPEDHPSMPGWFKGMEQLIRERGLWPDAGLPAQCHEFKCAPGRVDCCCRRLLYLQPDFKAQKSQLEELIEKRRHKCDFYPKYHCELNFIEQYWGAAKWHYRAAPRAKTVRAMESTVKGSLDSVSIDQIRKYVPFSLLFLIFLRSLHHRFANRAARFVSAYRDGLSGSQAAWANKKYHGHRTLPPASILEAKDTISA